MSTSSRLRLSLAVISTIQVITLRVYSWKIINSGSSINKVILKVQNLDPFMILCPYSPQQCQDIRGPCDALRETKDDIGGAQVEHTFRNKKYVALHCITSTITCTFSLVFSSCMSYFLPLYLWSLRHSPLHHLGKV